MARTCPSCGTQAIDDQSRFCNKCGAPFPEDQPKKVLVRTVPRLADTPPAPPAPPVQPAQPVQPVQPPVAAPPVMEYRLPAAAPPARSLADPPRARTPPARKPAPIAPVKKSPLPFKRLIAKNYIRAMYWLGVIAIILVVFTGVSTELSKTTKSASTVAATDATTDATAKSATDFLSGIPLFWIGIFIFANLLWRMLCEMSAALFALHDNAAGLNTSPVPSPEALYEDENFGPGTGASDEMVACPRCGKIVPADDLETCDHCGIQGCSNCVRQMGLLKKTYTCRECYQKK